MRRTRSLAVALLSGLTLVSTMAAARPLQGLYFSLGAGANLAEGFLSARETTKL